MKTRIVCVLTALWLAACGGGGGGMEVPVPPPADPTVQVPPGASESSAGLVGYLTALTGSNADALEPANVDGFDPPQPEDREPEPLP